MKKGEFALLFVVLMALLVPTKMMGQNTLTVYDGGNNSNLVPYSYYYRQKWQKCEFIIPASELSSMGATAESPKLITDMTFYHSLYGYSTEWTTFKVFMEEVGFEDFEDQSPFHGYDNATMVYEGRLDYTNYRTEVSFTEMFEYHGGNLLVGLYTTKAQIYEGSSTVVFYGTEVSNGALEGYDDNPENITPTIINFIPKTTFTYYDADYCFAPKWLEYDVNSVTATSVELDWTPRGSETEWGFEYSTDGGSTWTDCGVTASQHPYTLNNLQPGTEYYFSVYAKCGEDNDSEGSEDVSVRTLYCDIEDQCELHYELRSSDGDWGWGGSYIEVYYMPNQEDYLYFAELTLGGNGTLQKGDLTVCDGGLYDFVWNVGDSEALQYISFVITDSYGNPLYDSSIEGVPDENGFLLENYEVQCPSCKKPRDFSVVTASTSASFTWTADSGHQFWELQYSTDEVNWSATQTVTGNPTATINSLDPATEYFARVRANCGDGDYSPWAVISFYTDCATLVVDESHPYSEDFDSYEPYDPYGGGGGEWKGLRMEVSDRLPLCWSYWNGSDYYEYSDYPYIFNDYCEMESNGLKFYVYNYEGEGSMMDQYAILPAMENIADLMMSFKAKDGESSTSEFSIGVMTDPADATTFVEIQAFEVADEWNEFAVYFGNYLGQGEYIAIKVGTPDPNESDYLYIDDIVVSVLPTCFAPTGLAMSNISETTADVTWAPYGEETSWQVRYSTDKNNWTMIDCEEQNPGETITAQLAGLLANNLYYVQVRANCGDEDYSTWSAMMSFRTLCGQYQPIPYYEDFETCSYEHPLPQCWASINTTPTSGYPSYTNEPICLPDDPSNSISLYFWCKTASLDLAQYAILPYMQDIQSLKMSFVAKGEEDNYWNAYSSAFEVGVMTDPEDYTTFQTIMSQLDFHNATRYFTVYFDEYQGEGGYIAIKVPAETGSYKYLKVDNILVEQVALKPITAYSNENPGWNLIASPMVGSLQPTSVENMVSETEENYDLFAFDQSKEGSEWQNYKVHGFGLENGKGYLYANSSDVTLGFGGALQPAVSVEVPLVYVEGKPYAGWNLVGNPFNCSATLAGNVDFYRISGNTIAAASGEIDPCEGVFVQATTSGQSVIFDRVAVAQGEPETKGALNFNLYGGSMSHRLDLARVRFSEGDNLGKLNLLSDPNRIYFPIDGKDYAVAHVGTVGEMPLNFVAAENGRYSLSVSMEDVEMSYLHLIDNQTGAEVNLLETPVYSFEAKTTDYASRFKLVFAQGSSVDGDSFAFVRDGHLVVFGIEGQSTLQIVDITGRMVISESFSGSYDKQLNCAPGVYMLRLVNGDHVKVQKIIIK